MPLCDGTQHVQKLVCLTALNHLLSGVPLKFRDGFVGVPLDAVSEIRF